MTGYHKVWLCPLFGQRSEQWVQSSFEVSPSRPYRELFDIMSRDHQQLPGHVTKQHRTKPLLTKTFGWLLKATNLTCKLCVRSNINPYITALFDNKHQNLTRLKGPWYWQRLQDNTSWMKICQDLPRFPIRSTCRWCPFVAFDRRCVSFQHIRCSQKFSNVFEHYISTNAQSIKFGLNSTAWFIYSYDIHSPS